MPCKYFLNCKLWSWISPCQAPAVSWILSLVPCTSPTKITPWAHSWVCRTILSGPKGGFQGRSLKLAVNSTPSQAQTQIPVLMPPLEPELSSCTGARHKYLQDEKRFQNIPALSSQEEKGGYERGRSHGNSSAKDSPFLHLSLHWQEHLEDQNHWKSNEIH